MQLADSDRPVSAAEASDASVVAVVGDEASIVPVPAPNEAKPVGNGVSRVKNGAVLPARRARQTTTLFQRSTKSRAR